MMGQQLLPIFPRDTKYITPTLGVREVEGSVYYLHSGVPIGSHLVGDYKQFRYMTSNFLKEGLCKNVDIVKTFPVSVDSVRRNKKRLEEQGPSAFFGEEHRHGRSHKLLPAVLVRIQKQIDLGKSVNSIAKRLDISEGSIRYCIKVGKLQKKSK